MRRLLKRLGLHKSWNNEEEEYLWLKGQWVEEGFRSYVYQRDVTILKSIAEAVRSRDIQGALEASGRRLELLKMADTAKRLYLKNQD